MTTRQLQALDLEILHGLFHLRYLSLPQLRRLWMPERSDDALRKWTDRCEAAGLLRSLRSADGRLVCLASGGVRALNEHLDGRFYVSPDLKPMFLPHHLATNAVFCALAPPAPVRWSALPCRWLTKVGLSWQEKRQDEFGIFRSRRALLRPDAVIEVAQQARTFLEVDRSTECLREADDRRSIKRKMNGYAWSFFGSAGEGGGATYRSRFLDDIPPQILFVLTVQDRRGGDRRKSSIERCAAATDPRLKVVCAYADEHAYIRAFCGLEHGSRAADGSPMSARRDTRHDDQVHLQQLYRLAIHAAPRTDENVAICNAARDVLVRLRREGDADGTR